MHYRAPWLSPGYQRREEAAWLPGADPRPPARVSSGIQKESSFPEQDVTQAWTPPLSALPRGQPGGGPRVGQTCFFI